MVQIQLTQLWQVIESFHILDFLMRERDDLNGVAPCRIDRLCESQK
jgi:hypothetical protein